MNSKVWSSIPSERLAAARHLSELELKELHVDLAKDCPIIPWPYGNATTVNPFIVTLGVSPGNSPASGDYAFLEESGHQFPTAGEPHPEIFYRDTKRYWDKIRFLAQTTLASQNFDQDDILSLFGNTNLATERSGDAKDVSIKPKFAAWILHTIRCKLRPRFIIALGLPTYLQNNRSILNVFERFFPGFRLGHPNREIQFEGCTTKKFMFREWDFSSIDHGEVTLVFWPQHPSRPPFTNFEIWKAACHEFEERHRNTARLKE